LGRLGSIGLDLIGDWQPLISNVKQRVEMSNFNIGFPYIVEKYVGSTDF